MVPIGRLRINYWRRLRSLDRSQYRVSTVGSVVRTVWVDRNKGPLKEKTEGYTNEEQKDQKRKTRVREIE